jgi:signal transduction histidine kinase
MRTAAQPRKYLIGGFSAILLVLAAVIALTVVTHERVDRDLQTYRETTPRVAALDRMKAAASALAASANKGAALAIARYISSGDAVGLIDREIEDQRTERTVAKHDFVNALADLNRVLGGKTGGIDRDEAIDKISNAYLQMMAAHDAFFATLGNGRESLYIIEAWQDLERSSVSLLSLIGEELKSESVYFSVVDRRLDQTSAVSLKWIVGFSALGMIIATLLGFFATRAILRLFRESASQRQALETVNANLERAMLDLKALQQSVIDAERLATLGKLTATVSHELRNPLAAIRNSLFLIRQFARDPAKLAANAERAERNIKRCDNIIGDLLEYTRDHRPNVQARSLSKWVREVVEGQSLPHGVSIKFDLDHAEAEIMVDDDRFRRVLINLIENSAQAIRGTKAQGEILVKTRVAGGEARIDVIDDGPGIAADVLPRIFEPLFTTKNFGAGLGLTTAKRLVEQHDGRLVVTTEPGKGTDMGIVLPAKCKENLAA